MGRSIFDALSRIGFSIRAFVYKTVEVGEVAEKWQLHIMYTVPGLARRGVRMAVSCSRANEGIPWTKGIVSHQKFE